MRYLLLTSAAVLLIPAVALAQDEGNAIIIIQEDGSKVVVPMEGPADPLLPGAAPPMQEMPERQPEIIPPPKPEPSPEIEKREIEVQDRRFDPVTGQEEIGPAKIETREVAPVEAAPAKAAEPAPVAEEAPKAETKKSKKKKVAEKAAASKPAPPKVAGQYEFEIPPGTVIDERLASSIAMDAAPAAAGYTVSKHSYNGANVFVVTFKTDNGPYDVLVDAETGKVVLAAYVDEAPVPTAPGHLPKDWEPYTPQPVGKP